MDNQRITHIGSSDESHWNHGRYRTIALVTGTMAAMRLIETDMVALTRKHKINTDSELAWGKVSGGHKYRKAAIETFDHIANAASQNELRMDIIIWDTWDSRHDIHRRDDSENLARMYYHLINTVTKYWWPQEALWRIRGDQRTDTDWHTLEDCLKGFDRREKRGLQSGLRTKVPVRNPRIQVEQGESVNEPMIQVADLFAGVAAFSWTISHDKPTYHEWKATANGQGMLIPNSEVPTISRKAESRYNILNHIVQMELPYVKIYAGEGLRTHPWDAQKSRINFWLYEPQSERDKAPTRLAQWRHR